MNRFEKKSDAVISCSNVCKQYRLYSNHRDRIFELLSVGLVKRHQAFLALNDLSFDILKGETVGIIGQNGSGKSTLLKIICGISQPTAGEVKIGGRIASLLELGVGFSHELTGRENIYLYGSLMGFSKREMQEQISSIEEFADIGTYIEQPIKHYSNGMFVRLAFSCAINIDPDILIVDEALAVGDIGFQRKCYAKFHEFKNRNKTIIFVSHDMNAVNQVSDRVMLLSHGKILESGDPKYVTNIYLKEFLNTKDAEFKTSSVTISKPTPTLSEQNHKDRENMRHQAFEKYGSLTLLDEKSLEYGNNQLEIIDCGIVDCNGVRTTHLETGKKYMFYSRTLSYIDSDEVIFGCRIVNVKGVELFAASTYHSKVPLSKIKRGELVETQFHVTMWLATGEFFLTFGVWGKHFSVLHHRLADVIRFKVDEYGDNIPNNVSLISLQEKVAVNKLDSFAV